MTLRDSRTAAAAFQLSPEAIRTCDRFQREQRLPTRAEAIRGIIDATRNEQARAEIARWKSKRERETQRRLRAQLVELFRGVSA